MTVKSCKGPCARTLDESEFGSFYQAGNIFLQSRCKDCRRNIPADLEATRRMYMRVFPGDSQSRSWRTMASRLKAKGFSLNRKGVEKWESKALRSIEPVPMPKEMVVLKQTLDETRKKINQEFLIPPQFV